MPTKVIYLHGFASSAQSTKGSLLQARWRARGVEVDCPDLNRPSLRKLTLSAALKAMDEAAGDAKEIFLIGSSLGGYLSALWAHRNQDRVIGQALFCPGFNIIERWRSIIGEQKFSTWREEGAFSFDRSDGRSVILDWIFIEDAAAHPPFPTIHSQGIIIHGTQDEVIPLSQSKRAIAANPHVSLITVEDGHTLAESFEILDRECWSFFERLQSV